MTAQTPLLEIAAMIADLGGRDVHACMQCGTCTGVCPWPLLGEFSPRSILREMSLGFEGWEAERVWRCVTCAACEQACPRGLRITQVMRAARTLLQETGSAPRALGGPLASLRTFGNPWEGEPERKTAWAEGTHAPIWNHACESLLLPCCTQVYDPRNRRASHALVSLLRHAGLAFGAPPVGLSCCGEQARKVGAEDLFQQLHASNLESLRSLGASHIITSSPHCLDVLCMIPEVVAEHAVQVLWQLVDEGKIEPTVAFPKTVTYHDPCYLGRYAGVYDAPRRLLASVPGLCLREMPRHGPDSLCCGGGGGGLFQEMAPDQRLAVHRVREARETGAEVLVTACPYCMLMFEDAIKVLGFEAQMEVLDIAEVLFRSIRFDGVEAMP